MQLFLLEFFYCVQIKNWVSLKKSRKLKDNGICNAEDVPILGNVSSYSEYSFCPNGIVIFLLTQDSPNMFNYLSHSCSVVNPIWQFWNNQCAKLEISCIIHLYIPQPQYYLYRIKIKEVYFVFIFIILFKFHSIQPISYTPHQNNLYVT